MSVSWSEFMRRLARPLMVLLLAALAAQPGLQPSDARSRKLRRVADTDTLARDTRPDYSVRDTAAGGRDEDEDSGRGRRRSRGKVDIDFGPGHIKVDEDGDGDIVLMGDDIEVSADEVVDGDVVAIGGDVTILGKVYGDAVAIGGSMTLGDSAYVSGDAVAVGGTLDKARTAEVGGKATQVGVRLPLPFVSGPKIRPQGSLIGLLRCLVFYLVVLAFAALALYLARDRISFASEYLGREPFPSFLLGLLSPVLLVVGMVLLCITIIGIPVAVVLFCLYTVFLFLGWVVTGHRLGASVARNGGDHTVRPVFTGLMLISGLHILSVLLKSMGVDGFPVIFLMLAGIMISITSSLIGLGAILGTRFRRAATAIPAAAAVPAPGSSTPPPASAASASPPGTAPGSASPSPEAG